MANKGSFRVEIAVEGEGGLEAVEGTASLWDTTVSFLSETAEGSMMSPNRKKPVQAVFMSRNA